METIVPPGAPPASRSSDYGRKYLEILRWQADYHAELAARKYRAAASRPWLPVGRPANRDRNESSGIAARPAR